MRKALLSSLALLTLLSFGAGSCAKEATADADAAKPKFGFITNAIADFWTIAIAGVRKAEAEFGVSVEVSQATSKGGVSDQKNAMEDMITDKVKGIAISPIDPANQTGFLDKVAEQTILITHDSDAPASKRRCYIGVDNYVAGRQCGELVKKAIPDGGKVMLFIGNLGQDNSQAPPAGGDRCVGRQRAPDRHPSDSPNKYPIVSKDGKYTDPRLPDGQLRPCGSQGERGRHAHGSPRPRLHGGAVRIQPADDPRGAGKGLVVIEQGQGRRLRRRLGNPPGDSQWHGRGDRRSESVHVRLRVRSGCSWPSRKGDDVGDSRRAGSSTCPARTIEKHNVDAFEKELKSRLGK